MCLAEKLTLLTHDMLRQGSCVSLEIMRTLSQDLCEKDGLNVKLSREWVRAFLVSIDLSFEAAAQRSGLKVWTLPDKVVVTKRLIMKLVGPGLDKDVQLRRDMSLLEPDWQSRLVVERCERKTGVSETIETGCHCHSGHLCRACTGCCPVHFPWYH